jgi:hypothetical protein
MRVLKFIVDGQIVKRDPNCDFDNLVPGTEGYLQAEFSFSPEWDGMVKVAGFWAKEKRDMVECEPQWLEKGKVCTIPAAALKSKRFVIQLYGKKPHDVMILVSSTIEIAQTGGENV